MSMSLSNSKLFIDFLFHQNVRISVDSFLKLILKSVNALS